MPPLLVELRAKYPDEKFESNGTFYVGEKGVLYTGCYGADMHVVPKEKMHEINEPPRTLPRPENSFADFLNAVPRRPHRHRRGLRYGARLTEFAILGNLAQHAGRGNKVLWDGPQMKVTNLRNSTAS